MTRRESQQAAAVSAEKGIDHIILRMRAAIIVFLAATLVLIAGLGYATYKIQNVDDRVAKVEVSPCIDNPRGPACRRLLDEAVEVRSLPATCVSFKKALKPALYLKLTRCPPLDRSYTPTG